MNSFSPQTAVTGGLGARTGAASPSLWLGYAPTGGRVSLRLDEMKGKLLIGGHRSADLSALLACACRESGVRILVLDTDGAVSRRVSGYVEHYDYTCFLHDAFQIEEEESSRHGQLIAAAYAASMGLDSEEEAIVNAGLHLLAMHDIRASPAVLYERLDAVEGFRGFYVDKLKGRFGALKFLESAEDGSFRSLLPMSGSVLSFGSARYPEAVEVASAVFLAKLLALLPYAKIVPDIIMLTGAHRVFGGLPRVQHKERLLSELLDSRSTFVLASGQMHALSDSVWEAFPNKILSSDAWNDKVENRWREHNHDPMLPNAFAIADGHFGHERTFIARTFEPRFANARMGPTTTEDGSQRNDKLTVVVLEDVKGYEMPTRTSIIDFLSGEYGKEAVERELDRLSADRCIKLASKEPKRGGGHAMLVYTITEKGVRILEALRQ